VPSKSGDLAQTVKALRAMIPAKNFEISKRFYADLGFQPNRLTDGPAEMSLGAFSFLLQDYYVREWVDNLVMHMRVTDVALWWNHIAALDLSARYGIKMKAPQREEWGLVAGVVDPSGVLWRIIESPGSV
jgi:catechol 2,3-dioxygenase-like lactoylglutathione lyase family enzyme